MSTSNKRLSTDAALSASAVEGAAGTTRSPSAASQSGKLGCLAIFGLLLLTVVVTIAGTVWAIQSQLFARNFKPVELNAREQQTLEQKLDALGDANLGDANLGNANLGDGQASVSNNARLSSTNAERTTAEDIAADIGSDNTTLENNGEALQPELYVEDDSKRRIELTERELNALIAKNTDLGEQLVVDLTENLVSAKLLFDVPSDFPFLGGKTLKASGAAELSYQNDEPVIVMKGVSIWGVPIPNAWLGDLKNIDLVREFGGNDGFWQSLADGIQDIAVQDGKLLLQLAE